MADLTLDNYFDDTEHLSFSRLKRLLSCSASVVAGFNPLPSKAMMVSKYVDAYFSGTLPWFRAENKSIFLKDGVTLGADFRHADTIIERIKQDAVLSKFMDGEKQVILTGEIAGVKFKGLTDVLHPLESIVDLKVVKDFEGQWVDGKSHEWGNGFEPGADTIEFIQQDTRKRKVNWVEAMGYHTQLAIYQELYYQTSGVKVDCYIVAATKQDLPDIEFVDLPQEVLDSRIAWLKTILPRILESKELHRCGNCEYCRQTKEIKRPTSFYDLKV